MLIFCLFSCNFFFRTYLLFSFLNFSSYFLFLIYFFMHEPSCKIVCSCNSVPRAFLTRPNEGSKPVQNWPIVQNWPSCNSDPSCSFVPSCSFIFVQKWPFVQFYLRAILFSCSFVPSCSFIAVQFYLRAFLCTRAVLSPRAFLTATRKFHSRL